jgi:hypothetical protein
VYDPAGTAITVVMVVAGRERFASPSQVDAASTRLIPIKPMERI